MTPVLRIDDQVMDELNKRAIRLGNAFVTPNDILIIVLGLDMGAKKGSGGGGYISRPEKTHDLLNQVGNNVMFEVDTEVTIDKVRQTMKAGMTFKEAWDYSNNGGWRNRVRMAILKEAGLV